MSARGWGALTVSLALMGGLTACSSALVGPHGTVAARSFDPATDPYWDDPRWAKALLDATQAVVQDPVAPTDMKTVGPQVTIKFTFADGRIQDPAIIAGTGDPGLDDLLLKQVVTAQVPKPGGPHADEPHGFLLDLDMPTPFEAFQGSIFTAIDRHKVYPKNPILSGTIGATTLDFDYRDGQATSIAIIKPSKDHALDQASLNAVSRAVMPPAPATYAGQTWHMEVIVCYSLNDSMNCPIARNVIQVHGARIKTVTY